MEGGAHTCPHNDIHLNDIHESMKRIYALTWQLLHNSSRKVTHHLIVALNSTATPPPLTPLLLLLLLLLLILLPRLPLDRVKTLLMLEEEQQQEQNMIPQPMYTPLRSHPVR